MTFETDRESLIATREALKARLEHMRRLELIQPVIDVLNERGVTFVLQAESAQGILPAWPVVGNQIDWPATKARPIPPSSQGPREM